MLTQLSQLRHVETKNPLFFNGSSQKGVAAVEGTILTSQGSAQVGQTVSFVRQAKKRERPPAEKANRADTGIDPRSQWDGGDREAEPRPSAEVSLPEAFADEAGGRNGDPADYAVDEHGSGSQGEDLACRHHG